MQPKVSMVMPCYNKAAYIGHMFDSIMAQKWDNIELILVNDGSTDGTREVIAAYEPKFLARGFEVNVIDQVNMGLPGAVFEGLKRLTGEFVCQVDADDELDPEYVSMMAGWLAEHQDYEWAACDCLRVGEGYSIYDTAYPLGLGERFSIEAFILLRMRTEVWKYIIRASYLRHCGVVENYFPERVGSQEPQTVIPSIFWGGKLKYFPVPLYKASYLQPETHHSFMADLKAAMKYHKEWHVPIAETIKRLPVDECARKRYSVVSSLSRIKMQLQHSIDDPKHEKEEAAMTEEYITIVNDNFSPSPDIKEVWPAGISCFIQAVEDCILGVKLSDPRRPVGRVIAWGVLGIRGKRLLPMLEASLLKPDELWDASGDGKEIKKPDTGVLTADDLVIILPKKQSEEICAELNGTGCKHIHSDEFLNKLEYMMFPQFYDGSLKFNPKGD
jgi:glycosyltransferase involved in cell wall biosynthesis